MKPDVTGKPTNLIDTHVHLDDRRFDDDRDSVVQRAKCAGVQAFVIPAVSAADWRRLQQTASHYREACPAIGLHPLYTSQHQWQDLDRMESALASGQFTAIGECGLDGTAADDQAPLQHDYFIAQLNLARHYKLPVIIHAHRAVEATLLALRAHGPDAGVIHSYNGSLQQAHRLIDLGYKLSFGGPTTYPGSRKIHQLVQKLPLQSLMLETDAPFQPLYRQTDSRNEPANIVRILQAVAKLRNQPAELIAAASNHNASRLFSLPVDSLGASVDNPHH